MTSGSNLDLRSSLVVQTRAQGPREARFGCIGDVGVATPLNGTVDVAGPDREPFAALILDNSIFVPILTKTWQQLNRVRTTCKANDCSGGCCPKLTSMGRSAEVELV
ncbi:hypothetical protein BC1002_3961 [Paraburkholderia atlantica]|uniref:Uncharacterized protein n=1 Tax=Paraburkholderia atlantica TaxID=2654982 RepID=D5WHM4_PARAM|nr:hypothetical protein BC1002_3961 [Paraburkholderia atlantica]